VKTQGEETSHKEVAVDLLGSHRAGVNTVLKVVKDERQGRGDAHQPAEHGSPLRMRKVRKPKDETKAMGKQGGKAHAEPLCNCIFFGVSLHWMLLRALLAMKGSLGMPARTWQPSFTYKDRLDAEWNEAVANMHRVPWSATLRRRHREETMLLP